MTTANQRKQYERKEFHDQYQDHYYDKYSIFYREKVILKKLKCEFVNSKKILEIGCGGGSNLNTFLKNGLVKGEYHAIDISRRAVEQFQKSVPDNPKYESKVLDFTKENIGLTEKYDLILFFGVLHHMTNNLEQVFSNVDSCLSVGGRVICIEPNAHFLNYIRRLWYRFSDDFDHTNERALTASEIDELTSKKQLVLKRGYYFGAAGYFAIVNSMVLRMPKWMKSLSYKFLTYLDLFMESIQTKYHLAALIRIYEKVEK